jgi:hypothetical protein
LAARDVEAMALSALGDNEAALKKFSMLHSDITRLLGVQHPLAITILRRQATIYSGMNRAPELLNIADQILSAYALSINEESNAASGEKSPPSEFGISPSFLEEISEITLELSANPEENQLMLEKARKIHARLEKAVLDQRCSTGT